MKYNGTMGFGRARQSIHSGKFPALSAASGAAARRRSNLEGAVAGAATLRRERRMVLEPIDPSIKES
jgi:hypothetical protein